MDATYTSRLVSAPHLSRAARARRAGGAHELSIGPPVNLSALSFGVQCNSTFETAAAADPNLGLLSTAIASLGGGSGVIPSSSTNITVLAPIDKCARPVHACILTV